MPAPIRINGNGNWTDITKWSTGAAPATADTVSLNYGGDVLNANVNQSAVNLESLVTNPASGYQLGEAANPLEISVNNSANAFTRLYGAGNTYLSGGTHNKLEIKPSNASALTNLAGSMTLDNLYHYGGVLRAASGVIVSSGGVVELGSDSDWLVGGGTLRAMTALKGLHYIRRAFTSLEVCKDAVVFIDDEDTNITFGTIKMSGGVVFIVSYGTLGAITGNAGEWNESRLRKTGTVSTFSRRPTLRQVLPPSSLQAAYTYEDIAGGGSFTGGGAGGAGGFGP